jgi:hypothetical protein
VGIVAKTFQESAHGNIIASEPLTIGTTGTGVPKGTRGLYCFVPTLHAGTHSPAYRVDGTNWILLAINDLIDQATLPTAATSTGACRWGFQLPYYDTTMEFRVTSSVDQADHPILVVYTR